MSESVTGIGAGQDQAFEQYLAPTPYIDSDDPAVGAYALKVVGGENDEIEKARKLFHAVRDDIRYDPYNIDMTPRGFSASACLERGFGYCVAKATLLAAVGRAVGVPTRLGFADVRNHLASRRLIERMGTNIFFYHGLTEFHLEGKWVKTTPAFNKSLCEKFHVLPIDFDGRNDAIFHPFDAEGRKHMEYVRDRGSFADLPFEDVRAAMLASYPSMYLEGEGAARGGDLEAEAAAENES